MSSSVEDRLNQLRQERSAREKARIEKLRELNLKKYSQDATKNFKEPKHTANTLSYLTSTTSGGSLKNISSILKNQFQGAGSSRPGTAPDLKKKPIEPKKDSNVKKVAEKKDIALNNGKKSGGNSKDYVKLNINMLHNRPNIPKKSDKPLQSANVTSGSRMSVLPKSESSTDVGTRKSILSKSVTKNKPGTRKSMFPVSETKKKDLASRKSMLPKLNHGDNKQTNRESVFDRLYKPKAASKTHVSEAEKVLADQNYLKKVIKKSQLTMKRQTFHKIPTDKPKPQPVRRSISAVHFKRISKSELPNCIHKCSSVGNNLNRVHLKHIDEDEPDKQDQVVSAVKSEQKKVKFLTPITYNLHAPKPEELQAKLKNWLQKRGKSINSYHHLQCFGIHNVTNSTHKPKPFNLETPLPPVDYDEENKENIALDSDSDDASYTENMNDRKNDFAEDIKAEEPMTWRRVSSVSESVDLSQRSPATANTSLNSEQVSPQEDVVTGALRDLTQLCREGFEWEVCARWLRLVRGRYPRAADSAAYWECRAALEERRGDLPASLQCWEEALAAGTERSVAESNLDLLLDKFMKLKISPNSVKKHRKMEVKMVDMKNVVKSTLIRFAVQQAKIRQSTQGSPKYTVTPVRRSARQSTNYTRTPLQECTSMHIADQLTPRPQFVPNQKLVYTP